MRDSGLMGPWVRRFLLEHVSGERNLARNTQQSYRDALALLLPFVATQKRKSVDGLLLCDLSGKVLRAFLNYLEHERRCTVRTRNQRLAAVHAIARFVGHRSPEHVEWCTEIRSVPLKRTGKPVLPYLEKPEMDALLSAPSLETQQGLRDHALLLFLYNSGARASEAAGLQVSDLDLRSKGNSAVRLTGKGNKIRFCPLWANTRRHLTALIRGRSPDHRVFLNRMGDPITRYGIHTLVKRYVSKASPGCPSLLKKRVSPHTIRHTTAMHLLRSGVDINTIRAWLGHVSIDTTNVYVGIDLEEKARILAQCNPFRTSERKRHWREDRSLMDFLRSL